MNIIAPDNPWAEMAGQAVGGGSVLGLANAAEKAALTRAATPTVSQLTDEAGALYEAARRSGAVLPQNASAAMATDMRSIAAGEGIITPTGRINESYTKLAALIRSFDDYGTGALSVDQMQSVRRLIQNALKSPDGDERRIAMQMMDTFHRYLDPIAPQIAQANAMYHRAMNADVLETLIEVARQKSGQYGRSMDATLREQFGTLERQIIKGEVRGFSDAEREAISKVAQGGSLESILTLIGKAAPSGVVSTGLSGGVPFMVGNAFGGPVMGATAAGGMMGAGLLARKGANALTNANARGAVAKALIDSGAVPIPMITPNTGNVAAALTASQAANQNAPIDPVVQAMLRAQGLN